MKLRLENQALTTNLNLHLILIIFNENSKEKPHFFFNNPSWL